MSRLVFVFAEGGSTSTDVLLPKGDPTNHKLAIQRAMADLIPRTARGFPYKTVVQVVYKQYDYDFRTAFRDHVIPIDLEALNHRLEELRKEAYAERSSTPATDEPLPPEATDPGQLADPQPADPELSAPGAAG